MTGTGTAQGPAADTGQPASPRSRAPDQPHFLSALPPELRDEVAQHLAPRDVVCLKATYKQAKADFANALTAAEVAMEARAANLGTIDRLLNGPDGITKLPPLLQAEPWRAAAKRLGELARQVTDQPGPARTDWFDSVLQMVGRLPEVERGIPLTRIAVAIQHLPEPDRHPRFAGLLTQASQLPDADRLPLEEHLAKTLHTLATGDRSSGFRQVLMAAGTQPAESRRTVIQGLRHQLQQLPASDQLAAFLALVDRSRALGAEGAWEATHLFPYLPLLPPDAKHEAFSALTRRLGLLHEDDPHRLTAAVLLCSRIQALPPASHEEAARQIAEVLRPLSAALRKYLLASPDATVPPAVKNAMRQAVARDTAPTLGGARTSAWPEAADLAHA